MLTKRLPTILPPLTLEEALGQRRLVQPSGKGIVGRELPGLSSQHRENILGDFLRRAGIFDLAQRRGKYQVEMPPYEVGEGRLLTGARALQQFKVLAPIAHL